MFHISIQKWESITADSIGKATIGQWDDFSKQRSFINDLAKQLHITDKEDWYNVTYDTICRYGGRSLINNYYNKSLTKLFTALMPEYHHIFPYS